MKRGACIGKGNTAYVYEWGPSQVLKLFHHPQEARKEAANAEHISKLGVKAPQYGGLVEVDGQAGLIYERIEGPTLLETIQPNLESLSSSARMMARLQAGLHQTAHSHPPSLKRELEAAIRRSPDLSPSSKVALAARLERLPDGASLCHYDFHPGNIILSPEGPVVIDWMNVQIGDAAADAARTSMMLASTAVPPEARDWLSDRQARLYFHDAYVAAYRQESGAPQSTIDAWMLPVLGARLEELGGGEKDEILRWIERLEGTEHAG